MLSLSTKDDFSDLKAGKKVLLSGKLFTVRDKASARLEREEREELGFDISDSVIYHSGPLVKKTAKGWKLISAGPTTSSRMDKFLPQLIKKFDIKGIIGKGGVDKEGIKGCVYFAFTGGCGALAAQCMSVKDVYWLDLGIPEAVWELEVKNLPVVVGIDNEGGSLYR